MKKLLPSLRKKQPEKIPERITNDTVSEHRRRILAGGRKFKYPVQYSRHKLVINTVLISAFALIVAGAFGWWQLYPQQNASEFTYRVTSVVPVPVAVVDGQTVRYSDYLLKFRSAVHYLEQKEQTILTGEDNERQREYLKQQSLRDAISDAYAAKIAKEHDITVSDEELSAFLESRRQIDGASFTERTQYAVINDYLGWSPSEYAHVMRARLLRQKVAYEVDDAARDVAERAKALLAQAKGRDWKGVVSKNSEQLPGVTHGESGMVPRTNQDGGLAAAASTLEKGQMSDILRSSTDQGDYYAIIRLIDSNETQVNYEFALIPVRELQSQIDALYENDAVKLYIDVSLNEEGEANEQSE